MSQDIEKIKQKLDIVELLQEYLQLKQAGSNWKGLCPFHNEKSPSFMASQEKQIWHCFGCDKGGDIFAFIQEIEGVEFGEALRILALRAGVELQSYRPELTTRKTSLLDIIEQAKTFFQENLKSDPVAEHARQYLVERGITEEWQEKFGLGYSHDSWDRLFSRLTKLGVSEADLFAAGLVVKKNNGVGYYDRFRNRLMFPLYDINGAVVGFTARTLSADEPNAKYINSPQSDIYDKSRIVYGMNLARQAIKRLGAAIVVEGNMDVVSAHQAGFPNVVATSGTAFTEQQIILIKRYSENLLLAFDMDDAGNQAAQRSIEVALQQGMNVKVIQLPEQYKDPDECVQADPEAFREAIRNAMHILDFYFLSITKPLDLSRVEHKKKAVQQLVPILRNISDTVEQSHYIQQLADLVRVDVGIIQQQVAAQQKSIRSVPVAEKISGVVKASQPKKENRYSRLSRQVIALALLIPEQFKYCVDYLDPEYLVDEEIIELYKKMLSYYNNSGQLDESGFIVQYSEHKNLLDTLNLFAENIVPDSDPSVVQEQMISDIKMLHRGYTKRRSRELEYQLKEAEKNKDEDRVTQLLEEFNLLTQQLSEQDK
ncbi:MAG: DNA primase [bacterium]|nr:DNA primase [bacterium]